MKVNESEYIPQIGQVVRVLRGRDADKLAVVIGLEEDRFVWLADGDKRKFDSPKKKNRNHIELFDFISNEICESIEMTGRVTNGKIRFTLNKFKEEVEWERRKES